MKKKGILIVITFLICTINLGCEKSGNTTKKDISKKISTEYNSKKISTKDSLDTIHKKLFDASFFNEEGTSVMTIKKGEEYVKSILPDGVKEIESKYKENKGVKIVKYGIDNYVFYACYVHPYTGYNETNPNSFDIDTICGIHFSRAEVNSGWDSTKQNYSYKNYIEK